MEQMYLHRASVAAGRGHRKNDTEVHPHRERAASIGYAAVGAVAAAVVGFACIAA